jgi:hypothetical protein
MNNRKTFFIALIFLATITACVVPGLPTASAPLPTLTVDTGQVETQVAGTVSAAIAQTEQSRPSPTATNASTAAATATATFTATVTSTPTTTLTPVSTYTSTSTSTAVPTFTATPSPHTGISKLTRQGDGSMLFADERGGYEVKVPAGWLAVRVNEQEYLLAFSLPETANTHVQQSLLSVQNEDPNVFRLLALDTQAGHIQNEFVTDMRFVLDEKKNISLNSDADLQAIASKISASAEVFRFEVTSVKVVTSVSGKQFGVIEAKSSFANAAGAEVTIYQKQVFFNVNAGTQSIIFTTVTDLKNTLLPVFDAMLETIKIFGK